MTGIDVPTKSVNGTKAGIVILSNQILFFRGIVGLGLCGSSSDAA